MFQKASNGLFEQIMTSCYSNVIPKKGITKQKRNKSKWALNYQVCSFGISGMKMSSLWNQLVKRNVMYFFYHDGTVLQSIQVFVRDVNLINTCILHTRMKCFFWFKTRLTRKNDPLIQNQHKCQFVFDFLLVESKLEHLVIIKIDFSNVRW